MYLDYFSLNERPFSISPDPRFLFMSNRYREALTHLTYGVQEGGGFVLLTGEVGTGKTTVCRCLLQQLPQNTRLAFVLNPKLNSLELLATICDEFKIEYPENCSSLKLLTDKLSEFLLSCYQQNLNVVVMIDEAQNLASDVLEQIRLLTNLETNQKKLLQIILVGQPELQEKLAQRDLRQLAQRITARYHLRPLNLKETIAYILHRTRIAGSHSALFSRQAVEYLHIKTQGIPRLINTICDRSLVAAASRQKKRVDRRIMAEAVTEVMGQPVQTHKRSKINSQWFQRIAVMVVLLLVIGIGYWIGKLTTPSAVKAEPTVVTSSIAEPEAILPIETTSSLSLLERLIGEQRWDYNGRWSFQNLFKLWQIDYSPVGDGDACDFAAGFGLKCYSTIGNWQQLRGFNRPALLKFSAGLQGEFWGTLKSLQGLEAVVIFGEKETVVRLEELSTIWSGEFIIFWQAPEGYSGDIRLGDQGKSVYWLSDALNKLTHNQRPANERFDRELEQLLKDYQSQRDIRADGIAGMQSILKINAETLSGIPLLESVL